MIVVDACVARNFAILDWSGHLTALCGGGIVVAHGVLSQYVDEPGELDRIRNAFEREATEQVGTPNGSRAAAAVVGIDRFVALRSSQVKVEMLTTTEAALAVRLQDESEREWLNSLGVRARRLDAGEAASVAIAIFRDQAFATDDDAGRAAYLGLDGGSHEWTRDLMKRAVATGRLTEGQARAGYDSLIVHYRFWGMPWDG